MTSILQVCASAPLCTCIFTGGKDNPNCYFNQVQTQIAPATNMSHLLYSNPDTTTNR